MKSDLKTKMQILMDKYQKEYEELSVESEKLFDQQKELEKKYLELNKKTGLTKLFEKYSKTVNGIN